jgi:hypothetical protein
MADLIRTCVTLVLANYPLVFFTLGLVAAAISLHRSLKPASGPLIVEKLLAWHVFFAIGVYFFYNFVMHSVFGQLSARFIGWADSPFQLEVATASLGFAVVGLYAAFRGFEARVAAIAGPAMFNLGAAAGHVYQMVTAGNFAPGNAGLIFWMDIATPIFGAVLLVLSRREGQPQMAAEQEPRFTRESLSALSVR